ncbi:hypothetical protein ABIE26_001703 [Pedobacter africanus]|uniref:Uncharacterized protein n=1 Tax=Pedobacter africanus TaxID=151894 RepID=A0ACC6KR61_9SPHI|nr:hypothetical protein [Pedobacter africanus]MDR6781809.1 hypothetical protein [Pedobacter africanus]
MSTLRLLYLFTVATLLAWLPSGTFAGNKHATPSFSIENNWQDRRGKKQEKGKEGRKEEVKEVPQSRKQGKPEEVKSDKREKPKDNKRRND